MDERVVVVGGGISGLALAHAMRAGSGSREITVLEGSPRVGGPIRSERRAGFLCEWGPNGFLDDAPATLALCEQLGLRTRTVTANPEAARRFLVHGGRLRELPKGPGSFVVSDCLSFPGRLRVLLEAVVPRRNDPADESVRDFATRRLGREAAATLLDALVTGIWAGDPASLSLRSAFPVLHELEERHGSLIRGLIARRGARGRLTSFLDGLEELPLAIARSLGPRVRTNARVRAIARDADRFRIELDDGGRVDAGSLVLALPAWQAAPLLASIDAELARLVSGIDTVPVAVVQFGFPRPVLPGFGFLVPRDEHPRALGALVPSNIFPGRAPEGSSLVTVMLGGSRDPDAISQDDATLVAVAASALESLAGVKDAPVFSLVIRHERAIPQYALGHAQRLAAIDARLDAIPGLRLTGNSYRGISINACIEGIRGHSPFLT